jgi:sugar phosphate isomerase/epimerase
MRLGIFAKTFARASIEEVLDAVVAHGLGCIQFNFACAGLPSLPEQVGVALVNRITRAIRERNVEVAAVSGTFNLIHPDTARREDDFRRFETVSANSIALGSRLVTLCTGTLNPDDMWRDHPENNSAGAWKLMRSGVERALSVAERFDLWLGIEPEMANVVNSAAKARRLLDEVKSPRLKIVMDAANLLSHESFPEARLILEEAFDKLGADIAIAHAKDLSRNGSFAAAGKGDMPFDVYLRLLANSGFRGPLILHGLDEKEVDASVRFLRKHMSMTKAN